jgi:hypothetical protein
MKRQTAGYNNLASLCSTGIWQDDDGTCRYPKMCVSLYFEVFSSVLPQSFYGLLCSPDRPVIELIPVRDIFINPLVKKKITKN